jgi:predicted RNA-binding Zn-ribbon protein involved in translation (DUF1610 family)
VRVPLADRELSIDETHECSACGQVVRGVGETDPVRIVCPLCGHPASTADLAQEVSSE